MKEKMQSSQSSKLMNYISQELEDARRTLLSHAPSSVRDHAWISPDTISCNIRGSPPHTSQALTKLATKSGWLLVQQNKQSRSWKRKWCCVVPHTFLYMFDDPLESNSTPIQLNKESLNDLLSCGASKFVVEFDEEGRDIVNPSQSKLKPSSVVDLEFYRSINQMQMGYVLELDGDQSMQSSMVHNDDDDSHSRSSSKNRSELKPLYFKVETLNECKEWSDSFTSDRFHAVKNQCQEMHQINNNMNNQMRECVMMMEEEEQKRKAAEMEIYKVRSSAQQMSSNVIGIVRDALSEQLSLQDVSNNAALHMNDATNDESKKSITNMINVFSNLSKSSNKSENSAFNYYTQMNEKRLKSLEKLQKIVSDDDKTTSEGTSETVDILVEYTKYLFENHIKLKEDLIKTKEDLVKAKSCAVSKSKFDTLKKHCEKINAERKRMEERSAHLQSQLIKSRNSSKHSTEVITSHTLYEERIKELEEHKILLKKEILKLRDQLGKIKNDPLQHPSIQNGTDMDDKNFGIPESTALKKNPTSEQRNLSIGQKDSLIASESLMDTNIYQDLSLDSLGSMDTTGSKDEIFKQLQQIKGSKGNKWYSNPGCGDMNQFSKKQTNGQNRQSKVSVFDSSTWLCGQNNDDISL